MVIIGYPYNLSRILSGFFASLSFLPVSFLLGAAIGRCNFCCAHDETFPFSMSVCLCVQRNSQNWRAII